MGFECAKIGGGGSVEREGIGLLDADVVKVGAGVGGDDVQERREASLADSVALNGREWCHAEVRGAYEVPASVLSYAVVGQHAVHHSAIINASSVRTVIADDRAIGKNTRVRQEIAVSAATLADGRVAGKHAINQGASKSAPAEPPGVSRDLTMNQLNLISSASTVSNHHTIGNCAGIQRQAEICDTSAPGKTVSSGIAVGQGKAGKEGTTADRNAANSVCALDASALIANNECRSRAIDALQLNSVGQINPIGV